MKRLPVDLDMLIMALEDHGGETEYYLDVKTGDVLLVSPYGDDEEEVREKIENDSERYLEISPLENFESFRIMEDFVVGLPDGAGKRDLQRVLGRAKPFRNFKDALHDWPDLRKQWFEHQDRRLKEQARDWLAGFERNRIGPASASKNLSRRIRAAF